MKKMVIAFISALIVVAIGIFMVASSAYPSAPFLSGVALIIIALNLWMPYCPLCKKLCK